MRSSHAWKRVRVLRGGASGERDEARARGSRAAIFASVAAVGLACGARTDLGGERDAPANDAAPDCHAPLTVYGGPFVDAGCAPFPDASAPEDVTVAPPYGLPPDE